MKTAGLSLEEYATYHKLLTFAATVSDDGFSIPNDDVVLARVVGVSKKRFTNLFRAVEKFWPIRDDGMRWNPGQRERLDSEAKFIESQRTKGFKSAEARATGVGTAVEPELQPSIEPEVNLPIAVALDSRASGTPRKLKTHKLSKAATVEMALPGAQPTAKQFLTGYLYALIIELQTEFPRRDVPLIARKLIEWQRDAMLGISKNTPYKSLSKALFEWVHGAEKRNTETLEPGKPRFDLDAWAAADDQGQPSSAELVDGKVSGSGT